MLEANLILQQLWKIPLDWDEEIPSHLQNRWLKWLQTLKNIEKVKLPRWYGFLWTGSEIVLNYLNNTDTNFGVYIAHRIKEIRQLTDRDNWCYIKTEQNPADHTTCYQDFLSLSKNDSWIFGP